MHNSELRAKISCLLFQNLTKILDLVQEDGNKQVLLAQQQADSVRYLNELNAVSALYVPCKIHL